MKENKAKALLLHTLKKGNFYDSTIENTTAIFYFSVSVPGFRKGTYWAIDPEKGNYLSIPEYRDFEDVNYLVTDFAYIELDDGAMHTAYVVTVE